MKDTQELVEIEETDILGSVSDGKINIKRESSGHESTQIYLYMGTMASDNDKEWGERQL